MTGKVVAGVRSTTPNPSRDEAGHAYQGGKSSQ